MLYTVLPRTGTGRSVAAAGGVDPESGQTVLRGMGELHLEVTIDRMRTELGVEANMGKPKVSFREAFGQTVEHTYSRSCRACRA